MKLVVALARSLKHLHSETTRLLQENGLTPTQFGVIEMLYHRGDLPIHEINKRILSTGGNMTVVIDNLEKAGLVQRLNDPKDRRVSLINLTEAGIAKVEAVFPGHLQALGEQLKICTCEEKEQLLGLLKKIGRA